MGLFPTDASNGDEVTNANGTTFKYVDADDKWIIINNITVSDLVYGADWNTNGDAATKNVIYNEMETRLKNVVEDASPQLATDLDCEGFGIVDCDRVHFRDNVNAEITLEDHFTTDHRYHGIVIDIENGNLAFGLPGYISANNTVARAYANDVTKMPCIGVSVGDNKMLIQGVVYDLTYAFANGNPVYVTIAGICDDAVPGAVGNIVQVIGVAIDADTLLVNPSLDWVVRK